MTSDEAVAAEAFRIGASAYLPKTCAASELLVAVRKVLRGGSYISPNLNEDRINYLRSMQTKFVAADERLTDRQLEILCLIAAGKDMNEIADALNVTHRTVAFHK